MSIVNYCLLVLWLLIPLRIATNSSSVRPQSIALAEVTLHLAREYLSNLTSTVVMAEHSLSPDESVDKNRMLLEYVLQRLNGRIAVQFLVTDYYDEPWEYFILVVDSLEAFKEVIRHSFSYDFYERHFRFLIVLTKYTPDYRRVMGQMFRLCYNYDILDVNIIMHHQTAGVCMYTYFIFSKNVCRGYIPYRLHRFDEGFDSLRVIFPEKLNTFHGCPFIVSGRIVPPFFTFTGNKSDPKPIRRWENLSGIEGTLLKFLAVTLNFTIVLRPFTTERSYVAENGSYGCFSELKSKRVDLVVGGFVGSNPSQWIFSQTSPYHNAPYRYVVRGRRDLSSLGRLALPFSWEVWLLLAFFVILTITLIMILKFQRPNVRQFFLGEENYYPVTNFLALFLGYPVTRMPRRNFGRFILFQLLFCTLVIRNAYQGSLYDAFRMDSFARIPSGYDDLIKWNYSFLLPPEIAELDLFPKHRTIIVDSDGYEPRLEMMESLEGNYATVVIQDGYVFYMEKKMQNRSELFLISESIFNYQFVMFLPKHSIYMQIFNKKLKEFAWAGITERLSTNFTTHGLMLHKLVEQPKNLTLSNKNLFALYDIYAILILIAIIVFGLELLSGRYRNMKRLLIWIT